MVQVHLFYSGLVQGVCFRYTVHKYADELGVTGWVRNLDDGRVEVLVEGAEAEIEQFCHRIERHFNENISDRTMDISKDIIGFEDFRITY